MPVSQPRVTDLHMHDGEPLRFKASFEVLPEVGSKATRNCVPTSRRFTVTDEEVEQALTSVREQHATYSTVEGRALAEGDFAQASMDGKPKDGKDVGSGRRQSCAHG
jgi:trigger factor